MKICGSQFNKTLKLLEVKGLNDIGYILTNQFDYSQIG
jgi:hypothetical protein